MKKTIQILSMMAVTALGCDDKHSGIILENLDRTARPGADFYQYACGGWMEKHPLTGEYARFGSFDLLAENNRARLRELIEELSARRAEEGSDARKIGDLYAVAMDSAKLNAEGAAPVRADLERVAALRERGEIPALAARMRRQGFDPYFALYVDADPGNSEVNIVNTYQGGTSLGEREYYLDEDEHTRGIRAAFREHVAAMFALAGFEEGEATMAAARVMEVETRLATASRSAVELRDPLANYNKMSVEELQRRVPGVDWGAYLEAAGFAPQEEVNVGQPEALEAFAGMLEEVDLETHKCYLQWKVIDAAADQLGDAFAERNFDFYGRTLSGKEEMQPRWKRSVGTVNGLLGEMVGRMYVQKYFPAEAKERMVTLVRHLQEALGERVRGLKWMSEETKARAMEKLATVRVKVGYPDKWRDYSALEIKRDSYWANVARATEFAYARMAEKAGKPVDREEWLMTPQTVNAYYNPSTNEICFPAGILQYPFFDMDADDAFNYGAIGVVIGHEMTHGFDDQGRQYDKDGNLRDWWTAADAENFVERTRVLADHFDAIEVLPGLKANGRLTLGENIADLGGIEVAYDALQRATAGEEPREVDGFSPSCRFFLAYAALWAANTREEQVRVLTRSDPHSLGRWRVNGTLPHVAAWYEAFRVTPGDPLFLPEERRADIW